MNNYTVTPFDWFGLFFFAAVTIMFSHQFWANLFHNQVSKYSIDRMLVLLILRFGNEKSRKIAKAFTKDSQRILLFGVYALFSAIGGIIVIVRLLNRIFGQ